MTRKCFICHNDAECEEKLLLVKCKCPHCGNYAYEKNFVTSYEYYNSATTNKHEKELAKLMKKLIKSKPVCFVDDFETANYEGYSLYEFRDLLNLIGVEIAHNNTIDSNWKD